MFGNEKSSLPQKVIKPTLRQSKDSAFNDDLNENLSPYGEYDDAGMSARNKLGAVKKMRRKSVSNRSKSKATSLVLSL